MAQAVDFSFAHPDPAELVALGYVGALRYVAPFIGGKPNAKALTAHEVVALHEAGLSIGVVFESTATRASEGAAAGRADALLANKQLDELGAPAGMVVYFSVDFDADPAAVEAYFRGAYEASSRPIGGYGSFRVLEHLFDVALIVRGWQTTAWSHGRRSERAHLFQRVGGAPPGCDVNDILQADWGQWAPPGAQPAPGEDDMPPSIVKLADNGDIVVIPSSGDRPRVLKNPAVDIPRLAVFVYRVFEGHPGPADPPPVIDKAEDIAAIRADMEHGPTISGSFNISGAGQVG